MEVWCRDRQRYLCPSELTVGSVVGWTNDTLYLGYGQKGVLTFQKWIGVAIPPIGEVLSSWVVILKQLRKLLLSCRCWLLALVQMAPFCLMGGA